MVMCLGMGRFLEMQRQRSATPDVASSLSTIRYRESTIPVGEAHPHFLETPGRTDMTQRETTDQERFRWLGKPTATGKSKRPFSSAGEFRFDRGRAREDAADALHARHEP